MTTRRRQRDPHSAMVETWLDEVLADPTMTRMDFSVAWAVAMHFNRTTRVAWAGVDVYAKRCRTDRRTVQRSLRRLESAGHLAAIKGGGRKVTNRYQPVLKNSGAGAALSDAENSGAGPAVSASKRAAGQPQKGGEPAPKPPENSGAGAAQPLKERIPLIDSPRAGAHEGDRPPDDLDEAFKEFIRQWPPEKQSGKEATRALYKKIVRSGRATPAQLNGGAMRYGAVCMGRELRHIASPLNYLKDGKWDEQYAAPASAPASSTNNPREVAAVLKRTIFAQRGRP